MSRACRWRVCFLLLLAAVAALYAARSVSAGEAKAPEKVPGSLDSKIRAEAVVPKGSSLAVGRFAPWLKVTVFNADPLRRTAPAAVALRSVQWAGYPADRRQWLLALFGMDVLLKDGTIEFTSGSAIAHTADTRPATKRRFEMGLILPNGSLTVPARLTPQRGGRHELIITFVEIPRAGAQKGKVFLPRRLDEHRQLFEPLARGRVPKTTVPAFVPQTGTPGAAPLPLRRVVVPVRLPIRSHVEPTIKPKGERAGDREVPGGQPPSDVARHARLGPLSEQTWVMYSPTAAAWFFVQPAGRAVAARLVVDTRAKISPDAIGGMRWQRTLLPNMDLGVPEEFGRSQGGATEMRLDPKAFGDIVGVEPQRGKALGPATRVPRGKLWAVLRRAHERRIRLRLFYRASGGPLNARLIAAGVRE